MAIENKKLENPLYWADPNTWGSNGRKEKRGLTALRHEVAKLRKALRGRYYGGDSAIRHLHNVEKFAMECSFQFRMSDPECFEESLFCGIAVIVVRVSASLTCPISEMIDVALLSTTIVNLFTIQ